MKKAREWVEKDTGSLSKEEKEAQKRKQKTCAQWPRILNKFLRFLKNQEVAEKKAVREAKKANKQAEKSKKDACRAAKKAEQEEEKAQKKLEREKKKAENSPTRTNAKSGYGLWRKSLAGNHYSQADFSKMWVEISAEDQQKWKDEAAKVNAAHAEEA